MQRLRNTFEQIAIASHLLKWTLISIPVSAMVGSAVALFLWLLDWATSTRWQNPWLLWFLPLAGVVIWATYKYVGKNSEAGNNLIMEEIHEPGGGVPLRMTPLVLATTIITHLFGGSAGREGTAVQMGGSLAQLFAKWFRLNKEDVRTLLMMGIAAGFGAVFGTPVTGAIFALEVLAMGRISHKALLPVFMASVMADIACAAWGLPHTRYHISVQEVGASMVTWLHIDLVLLAKVIAAGIAFGLAGFLFSELLHMVKSYSARIFRQRWMIPVVGGISVIGLSYALGTTDYLGLGVSNPNPEGVSILSSFREGGADPFSWGWKIIFTVITLGMGFKGGEVTPLFFIGATLGNALATFSGAPVDLMAGLGFIAVFAAATNTPIACTFMGVELFGGDYLLYYAVACFTAYYFSGHSGIYHAQRLAMSKTDSSAGHAGQNLKEIHEKRARARRRWLGR